MLYRTRLEWEERRDAFPAALISMQTKDKTPQDILQMCGYPTFRQVERVLIDPDRGAASDWQSLRDHLKGKLRGNHP